MPFNSIQFAVFFAVVWLLHRGLPSRWRNGFLLGASLVFYGLWMPTYLLLLLGDILVNYALLRQMVRSTRPQIALVTSVVVTLSLLAGFKYAALAIETIAPALRSSCHSESPSTASRSWDSPSTPIDERSTPRRASVAMRSS